MCIQTGHLLLHCSSRNFLGCQRNSWRELPKSFCPLLISAAARVKQKAPAVRQLKWQESGSLRSLSNFNGRGASGCMQSRRAEWCRRSHGWCETHERTFPHRVSLSLSKQLLTIWLSSAIWDITRFQTVRKVERNWWSNAILLQTTKLIHQLFVDTSK